MTSRDHLLVAYGPGNPSPVPGNYYVSAVDGPKFALLAGPYTSHAQALDMVPTVTEIAMQLDPKAAFYGFGTCRTHDAYNREGILNKHLAKLGREAA